MDVNYEEDVFMESPIPPHLQPPIYPIFRRRMAAFLDYAFVILLALTFYRFVKIPIKDRALENYILFGPIIWFIYFPFIEFWTGATLGKWLFGLKVISTDRSQLQIHQNISRHVLDLPDLFYFGFAFLAHPRSQKLQRLGDKWAGTMV